MNAKSMVVLSAAIAMIAHTGTVLADVPLNEHPVPLVSNDVPVGATQSLSPNLCIPERTSIVKTGGGTLAVPASAPGIAPLRILAREGFVSVQSDLADTGAALPELSDSIMAKLHARGADTQSASFAIMELTLPLSSGVASGWCAGSVAGECGVRSPILDIHQRDGDGVFRRIRQWTGPAGLQQ